MDLLLKILYYLTLSFFIIASPIYIWHKLLNKKINFKNYKLYVTLFSLMIIALINYFNNFPAIRITVITAALMLFFRFLFKENLQKCIITPIFSQMMTMISETIYAFGFLLILRRNPDTLLNSDYGYFITNVIIALISMGLVHFKAIKFFYKLILNLTDKLKKTHIISLCFLLIIISNVFAMTLYYKVNYVYMLIFNVIATLICFLIVLFSFRTQNKYIKTYDKYNTTLNSLKEYEDILDKYRVSNHENKNQLLTIRNMLPKNNKKVVSYIDTIIENKLKDNDKVMFEAAKIPAGGLRGLIYSKVLLMKNLGIKYEMEISKDVRTVDLINDIDDSTMLDICQIIGVYLDNSIQAVECLEEKYVDIEMYLDKKDLVISISNNYEGTLDIEKIEEKGYTSKGDQHGYGLTLAKEIIERNNKISNGKKISKEVFTQILKINM